MKKEGAWTALCQKGSRASRTHIHCPDDCSVCEEGTLRGALGWPGIGAYYTIG